MENNKKLGMGLPIELHVENLSIQFGDCHSNIYYNSNECFANVCDNDDYCACEDSYCACDNSYCNCDDDCCECEDYEYCDYCHGDDFDEFDVDENEPVDTEEVVDSDTSDSSDNNHSSDESNSNDIKHTIFEGLSHEDAYIAAECLLKAIFPEMKDKSFAFAVGTVETNKKPDGNKKVECRNGK